MSPVFGPLTLVTGVQPDATLHCRISFGAYCEVNDEPNPSNTEKSRTTPCLALGPHDLHHGSYWFLSLNTGQRLHRDNWTELPMTDTIVDMVHLLADNERPPREESVGDSTNIHGGISVMGSNYLSMVWCIKYQFLRHVYFIQYIHIQYPKEDS